MIHIRERALILILCSFGRLKFEDFAGNWFSTNLKKFRRKCHQMPKIKGIFNGFPTDCITLADMNFTQIDSHERDSTVCCWSDIEIIIIRSQDNLTWNSERETLSFKCKLKWKIFLFLTEVILS